MYVDTKRSRILLRDGTSLVDEFTYVTKSMDGTITPNTKIIAGAGSDVYRRLFNEEIGCNVDEDVCIIPPVHTHTDSDIGFLLKSINESPRYVMCPEYDNRLAIEFDYFEKTDNIVFLVEIKHLIDRFRSDGIVWGVGRGSSCSSLILFILGVHDLNPLTYDIPFSELSKEQDSKYGD